MSEDLKWLIGTAITLSTFFGGALLAAFRSLSSSIKDGDERLAESVKAGDDQLHERVNRVRDEYVRRVDYDDSIKQLRESVKELRDETREGTKETHKRLDQVLAELARDRKSG